MAVKTIIDRKAAAANRRRAENSGVEGADFLLEAVSDDLLFRLSAVAREFDRALLFSPLPGALAGKLFGSGKVRSVETLDDMSGDVVQEEALGLGEAEFDLGVSLLNLHETNDTPGILAQMRRALRPDGLFLACTPGGDTLHELRDSLLTAEAGLTGNAHARVLPFMDVRDAGGLLQRAGFALPVTDVESFTVRYDTIFHLMRDLRAMGATNTLVSRSRKFATLDLFRAAGEVYADRYSDADGRIRATFTLVWMSGWVPHESQQKPLKPGSASHRLADFIGDKSTGDRSSD